MNIKPIGINILVRPNETKEVTDSGIIIPIHSQERPSVALVLAVGEGLKDNPMVVEVGDIIYHVKNCGTPIVCDGEILYFLRLQEVLAIIAKDKTNGVVKNLEKAL